MPPFAVCVLLAAPAADPAATPEKVFETRILPIFNSPDPSSCAQCHLAGVDLKNYIRPTHRETFLSLRDQGLIDLDAPEKSKILALIAMGNGDKGASLIHEKNRKAESDAFAAWVKAGAADPELRAAPKLPAEKLAKPPRPDAVIRHARTDRLLESFTDTVWAMRFRCMNCHTAGTAKAKEYEAEHGDRIAWFKADAASTLESLRAGKLIDAKDPEKSLLLLKPLNAVKHEGGQKFRTGDQGYKAFRRFLDDYAKVVGDKYAAASDLPKPPAAETFGTDLWLKLTNTPPAWADKLLVAKVFAWDATAGAWEAEPVGATDRVVNGKNRLWQHSLILTAPRGSDRAKAWKASRPALPEGRYLVKVYVDAADRLAKDPAAEIAASDYVGSAEVRTAWPGGYGKMTVLDAGAVNRE